MKFVHILKINLVLFLILTAAITVSAQTKIKSKTKTYNIGVNFNGDKAKARIEQELKKEKGISKVAADTLIRVVSISYFEKISNPEKINLAIKKMGYMTTLSSFEKKKIRSCKPDVEKEETKK